VATLRRVGTWVSWERPPILSRIFQQLDRLVRSREEGLGPLRVGSKRALVLFLLLFSLASIAVSQAAFLFALTIAIVRHVTGQRGWRIGRREPSIEWPLGGFLVLTILSSVFSAAPAISLVKLKTIGLFLILFLVRSELSRRGGQIVVGCVVVSSLMGVGYSWLEKGIGRGIIVTSVKVESQWWKSGLRPGDLIWMVDRKRVRSIEEIGRELAARDLGERVSVEALHAGDPLPMELRVTQEMRTDVGTLGIAGSRAGRQFRVSGFSRQFLTYAEQMQLLALLALGWGLVGKRRGAAILLSLVFTATLLLTATRSVTLSLILAVTLMAWWSGGTARAAGWARHGGVARGCGPLYHRHGSPVDRRAILGRQHAASNRLYAGRVAEDSRTSDPWGRDGRPSGLLERVGLSRRLHYPYPFDADSDCARPGIAGARVPGLVLRGDLSRPRPALEGGARPSGPLGGGACRWSPRGDGRVWPQRVDQL